MVQIMGFWKLFRLVFQLDNFKCAEVDGATLIKVLRYGEAKEAKKKKAGEIK